MRLRQNHSSGFKPHCIIALSLFSAGPEEKLRRHEKAARICSLLILSGFLFKKMVELVGMPQKADSERKSHRNPLIFKVKMSNLTKFP